MAGQDERRIIEVDMRGQVCPATLLVAMDQMNRNRDVLQSGAAWLRIKTDNRHAINTIPATAQNMGYEVGVRKERSYYEIVIGSSLSQEMR